MSASLPGTASERRGNNFKRVERLLPESQGQDLALTVLHVPDSLLLAGVDQEERVHHSGSEHLSTPTSDIDINILFSKIDSP